MHRRACEEEEKSAGPQSDAARTRIVISRLVEVVYVKAGSPDVEPITEKLARLQALLAEDRVHNARAVLEPLEVHWHRCQNGAEWLTVAPRCTR